MTAQEIRSLMAKAAMRRDTSTYEKLKYELSLAETSAEDFKPFVVTESPETSSPVIYNNMISSKQAEGVSGDSVSFTHESFEEIAAFLAAKIPSIQPKGVDSGSLSLDLHQEIKVEPESLISAAQLAACPESSTESSTEIAPLTEEEIIERGSVIKGARRICNHCGHEFKGEIPWSCYVDETGTGLIPRCEICGLGRIMTVVGDSLNVAKCYHKCPKCEKAWSHGLNDEKCSISSVNEALCKTCKAIRQEVVDEFLRVETHRSEQKLMHSSLPKESLQIILDEEQSPELKAMTDEELDAHIRDLDRQSTEIIARNKGARKHRAARFDALDDREKQRVRQDWKEVGALAASERVKKVRAKEASSAEDKNERGVQSMMLAFNYDRAKAEVEWAKLLESRKKKN